MNLKSLITNLVKSLNWHPERCLTFASMVASLIDQHNVQHHALSRFLNPDLASLKSRLERIRRFFQKQSIDYEAFAKNIVEKVFSTIPSMDIIIDRTNWKFGKNNVNYLVLAALIGNVTFPLFWSLLNHQGCSDAKARIQLMEKFKKTFCFGKIRSFIADREFIGQDWLDYLYTHKVPFYIRIKDNRLIHWHGESKRPLKDFFKHLAYQQEETLFTQINKLGLFLAAKKLKEELLIVCSTTQNTKKALQIYRRRWSIETCFKNMKSKGFNLEATHMSDLERLNKLMAIVTVTILFSSLVGMQVKCPYKKTVQAPLYSIFTRGMRALQLRLWELDISSYCLMQNVFFKSEG